MNNSDVLKGLKKIITKLKDKNKYIKFLKSLIKYDNKTLTVLYKKWKKSDLIIEEEEIKENIFKIDDEIEIRFDGDMKEIEEIKKCKEEQIKLKNKIATQYAESLKILQELPKPEIRNESNLFNEEIYKKQVESKILEFIKRKEIYQYIKMENRQIQREAKIMSAEIALKNNYLQQYKLFNEIRENEKQELIENINEVKNKIIDVKDKIKDLKFVNNKNLIVGLIIIKNFDVKHHFKKIISRLMENKFKKDIDSYGDNDPDDDIKIIERNRKQKIKIKNLIRHKKILLNFRKNKIKDKNSEEYKKILENEKEIEKFEKDYSNSLEKSTDISEIFENVNEKSIEIIENKEDEYIGKEEMYQLEEEFENEESEEEEKEDKENEDKIKQINDYFKEDFENLERYFEEEKKEEEMNNLLDWFKH